MDNEFENNNVVNEGEKKKLKFPNKYITIGIVAFLVIAISIFFYYILHFNIKTIFYSNLLLFVLNHLSSPQGHRAYFSVQQPFALPPE